MYRGLLSLIVPMPLMRTLVPEPGWPEFWVMVTPETIPLSRLSTRVPAAWVRASPLTELMAAVTTLFFCTP